MLLVVDGGRARNDHDNNFDGLLRALRAPDPFLAHGVPLTKAWDHMLDVFARSVEASKGQVTSRQRNELEEAVRDVTNQLQAQGLGYVLTAGSRTALPVRAGVQGRGDRVRDDGGRTTSGAVAAPTRQAQHGLERIDENVASDVMPVLAEGTSYRLADREWLLTDPGKALAAKIGEVVRREYKAALGGDAKAVDEIAKLLAKRNEIVDEWRDHLERKRIFFVRTETSAGRCSIATAAAPASTTPASL